MTSHHNPKVLCSYLLARIKTQICATEEGALEMLCEIGGGSKEEELISDWWDQEEHMEG